MKNEKKSKAVSTLGLLDEGDIFCNDSNPGNLYIRIDEQKANGYTHVCIAGRHQGELCYWDADTDIILEFRAENYSRFYNLIKERYL